MFPARTIRAWRRTLTSARAGPRNPQELRAEDGHGQEPEAETIAQLVATTLARLYGRPADGFSWSYISMYAQSSSPQMVGRLCMRVLDRTRKVLELIYAAPDGPPAT